MTVNYSTSHAVTLSVQDWVCIQSQLAVAALHNSDLGHSATAEVIRDVLDRMIPQTDRVIEAAAGRL